MKTIKIIILTFLFLNKIFGQTIPTEYYRLIKEADSLFMLQEYKMSAFTYSDAFKTIGWKGFSSDRYNAACAWALAGYPDSALFNLERITYKAAYADIHRINSEKHFSNLRSHKRWKPLLVRIKSNADSIAAIEAKLDKTLIRKLDSLTKEDQKWRQLSRRFHNNLIPKDSIDQQTIFANMVKTDSLNTFEVRRIFYKYGFPNYDLAGKEGSGNFWLLVQHQDRNPSFQDSVLIAMKIETEKGKASKQDYAYLADRVKVNTRQLQIYGTQMKLNTDHSSYIPQQVIDPEKLNERRKSVGLGTIEEYIKIMNTHYFGTLKND